MSGRYIVVEGLEGAGKTTGCKIVLDMLKERDVGEIIVTREPGGTYLAEKMRSFLLDTKFLDKEIFHHKAEILIFYAARIQLIETIIKPALANGKWVISDRDDLSTQAYQGGGRRIDQKTLATLRNLILGDFFPDLTLYLDVTPEVGLQRTRGRGELDRIERESYNFFKRTRERYCKLASQNNAIRTINATQPLEEVIRLIRETVTDWIEEKNKS